MMLHRVLICIVVFSVGAAPWIALVDEGLFFKLTTELERVTGGGFLYGLACVAWFLIALFTVLAVLSGIIASIFGAIEWSKKSNNPIWLRGLIWIGFGPIWVLIMTVVLIFSAAAKSNPDSVTSSPRPAKPKKKSGPVFGSHFVESEILGDHYHVGGKAVLRKLLNGTRPY
tara:strand:+ start:1986 stop:2498 length:513 start_codon:yes stop_codon:yes gene_type:complete